MRLFRQLQHWLGRTGSRMQVADFVPDVHSIRLWAETFLWDALVAAIEQSVARRFPKQSARGRSGVSSREKYRPHSFLLGVKTKIDRSQPLPKRTRSSTVYRERVDAHGFP